MQRFRVLHLIVVASVVPYTSLASQVAIQPTNMTPAGWERIALRVVNQTDTAITAVRLTVPEMLGILGVDSPEGWTFEIERATASTPQVIEWTGDSLLRWEFKEFAFFGRLAADARRKELVFPVRITRANGAVVDWGGGSGVGVAPVVQIVGTTRVTAWGTFALAGAAIGLSVFALSLALANRKPSVTTKERFLGRDG